MGCLAYADNIILLNPTRNSSCEMLQICEQFSHEYNIEFNASKSRLMIFGKRQLQAEIVFQGMRIPQVTIEKHVGNLLGTDRFISNVRVNEACNGLYVKFNLLVRQFGKCSPRVLYRLFNTYCTSFFGNQLWDYADVSLIETVSVAWRKCVRRIFDLPYNAHCNLLHLLCDDSTIKVKLHKRFLRFFFGLSKSNNAIVSRLSKTVLDGSRSTTCASINFICSLYNIDKYNLTLRNLVKVQDINSEGDRRTAQIISDFIDYKVWNPDNDHLYVIIENLCTS